MPPFQKNYRENISDTPRAQIWNTPFSGFPRENISETLCMPSITPFAYVKWEYARGPSYSRVERLLYSNRCP